MDIGVEVFHLTILFHYKQEEANISKSHQNNLGELSF